MDHATQDVDPLVHMREMADLSARLVARGLKRLSAIRPFSLRWSKPLRCWAAQRAT